MIERTSSTSGSTGTGLKKCSPSTRSGFDVPAPSFMIGTDDVLEARNCASGRSSSSRVKSSRFSALVLDDRLDRGVGALDVLERRGEGEPLQRRGLVLLGQLARAHAAVERLARSRACERSARSSSASTTVTSTPDARAHLRDPRAHEAATDHSDSHGAGNLAVTRRRTALRG